jgi:hypothetical protein
MTHKETSQAGVGDKMSYNVARLWVVCEEVQDAPALLDVGLGIRPACSTIKIQHLRATEMQCRTHKTAFTNQHLRQPTCPAKSTQVQYVVLYVLKNCTVE